MNITLMAHDKKKELMVQFCTAYKSILSKHSLSATAATGRLVSEATGLPVTLFLSKSQGGHQQIDARIAYNEIDLVFMFSDPNDTDPWEDQRIMRTLRLCDTYNVPCATNLASAEMLILGLQRGDLDWRMRRERAEIAGPRSPEPAQKRGDLKNSPNLGGTTKQACSRPKSGDGSIFFVQGLPCEGESLACVL